MFQILSFFCVSDLVGLLDTLRCPWLQLSCDCCHWKQSLPVFIFHTLTSSPKTLRLCSPDHLYFLSHLFGPHLCIHSAGLEPGEVPCVLLSEGPKDECGRCSLTNLATVQRAVPCVSRGTVHHGLSVEEESRDGCRHVLFLLSEH